MRKPSTMKKVLKKSAHVLLIMAMLGTTYSLAVAFSETILVDQLITDFIARADDNPAEIKELYDYEWHYYPITRIEDYELADHRDVFYDDAKREIGNYGDVLLTRQSAFKDLPFIHQFVSYYFGGHASFINDDGGIYETTGVNVDFQTMIDSVFIDPNNHPLQNVSIQKLNGNYWLDKITTTQYSPFYRTEVMSVRVKDVTLNQIQTARDFLEYHYQNRTLYNYLFWLNMKDRFYCSDLISRAYQSSFYDENEQREYSRTLNYDGFITSINDIILAQETYLTSYIKIDTNHHIVNIYYLADLI